jgi:hypothetical protein
MGSHLLGDLQSATVIEVRCDPGRAEGGAADLSLDPGVGSPSSNSQFIFSRMIMSFIMRE